MGRSDFEERWIAFLRQVIYIFDVFEYLLEILSKKKYLKPNI